MFYLVDFSKKKSTKVAEVMREYKEGTLNSGGTKKKVRNRKQAIAIALSEADKMAQHSFFQPTADFAKPLQDTTKGVKKKERRPLDNWEKARELRSGVSTAQRVSQDIRGWLSFINNAKRFTGV
jgi:DUF4097 and DUF4098 domain-containing protein YvlB